MIPLLTGFQQGILVVSASIGLASVIYPKIDQML